MIRLLWREALRRSGLREILDRSRAQTDFLDRLQGKVGDLATQLKALEADQRDDRTILHRLERDVALLTQTQEATADALRLLLHWHEAVVLEQKFQTYPGYDPKELAILARYTSPDRKPEAGFVVDFMGVRTRASDLWPEAQMAEGTLLPLPIPCDFHAETAEWISVLSAVDKASDSFAMAEIGAGWGPWLVAAATACRKRGLKDIFLLGVEPDRKHFEKMMRHFEDNGLNPGAYVLLNAAVGTASGRGHLSPSIIPDHDYGRRILADSLPSISAEVESVELIDLKDILSMKTFWNLIHIDVQGSEAEIIAHALPELKKRVQHLVIGTHSRVIEGRLIDLLHAAGWRLEREKPCRIVCSEKLSSLFDMTRVDGLQAWRNTSFT